MYHGKPCGKCGNTERYGERMGHLTCRARCERDALRPIQARADAKRQRTPHRRAQIREAQERFYNSPQGFIAQVRDNIRKKERNLYGT